MSASWWWNEEASFDRLVVLTDEVLYVGNPKREQGRELLGRLQQGEPPGQVLKGAAETVLLADLKRVQWDRKQDDVDLRWGKDDDKHLVFESSVQRDEFAAALTEKLHGFEGKTVEFSKLRAALAPGGFGLLATGMTWLFYHAALALEAGDEADIRGRNKGIKQALLWIMETVGPTGVVILGGIVVALSIATLVKRVGDPPIMTTLKPGKK